MLMSMNTDLEALHRLLDVIYQEEEGRVGVYQHMDEEGKITEYHLYLQKEEYYLNSMKD